MRVLPHTLAPMPNVVLNTGFVGDDGHEERIAEYLCDWPECANTATQVVGLVVELRASVVVCPEHAALIASRAADRLRR